MRTLAAATWLLALAARISSAQTVTTTGTITTYAGPVGRPLPATGMTATTQAIDAPAFIIPDGAGGFYFTSPNQNRVYRVDVNGTLVVVAGTGTAGFSGDGGPAVSARLTNPGGLALDVSGNLFIAAYE